MATLKEIQDAIDNKTFDPSKLSRQERNLVDEAIKRGLIKGPTTRTITGQRQSAARDVATMDAASKNPIGVALQQQDSFFKGRNEAILAGDLIGSIYPYVADRKKIFSAAKSKIPGNKDTGLFPRSKIFNNFADKLTQRLPGRFKLLGGAVKLLAKAADPTLGRVLASPLGRTEIKSVLGGTVGAGVGSVGYDVLNETAGVAVMDGMVNMDDLLTSRPGGVVRTKQQPNQVMQPIQAQPISQQAFPLLEYLDTVREVRTGVTKYNQGLDSDSLNKTATGISAIMNQTQMRAELIARIFAETGVKDLFRKMFELSVKYQDKEKIIQLNNQYIPVMPTEWKNRFNITIQVGLGTGTKEQQLIILNNILDKQLQAFNLQGQREFPMVSLKNIYNTLSKIVENAGLKTVDSYFINPDLGRQFVTPPPPPPVTPIEKIEFTRIDAENKRKIADLELEYKELQQKQQEMLLDFETRIKDMALKYNTQLDTAKIKADADLDKTLMSGNNKILEQAQKSGNILSRQIQSLNEPQRQSQESRRIEQGNSGETDITE